MSYFDKVLIANRGEIAIRVMRACRELDIETVAIYSTPDQNALHTKYADEAFHIGEAHPSKSYLNIERIIEIGEISGAEAVHPGYGFLAENYHFAEAVEKSDLTFIGPSSQTIHMMGSKLDSKETMSAAGVPVLPWTKGGVRSPEAGIAFAEEIGYPVIVKASAGGGGIGMQIVWKPEELAGAIEKGMRIAESAFGDPTIFIEKYLDKPRHIEVQVLSDSHGNNIHLFERECSIQRRHQKLIEEAPCPIMTPELREQMTGSALTVAESCDYTNAGTVEFLYADGEYYFMEMNTRLQVEHTITEMITGIDIVRQQIAIASGAELAYEQDDVTLRGHAIECRINAEDPLNNFAADPGKIVRYRSPGGPGIRVDSGIHVGYAIPPQYDSLLSKLCAYGLTRTEAIERMRRAIYEYVLLGVKTTLPMHLALMFNRHFIEGNTHTHFLQEEQIMRNIRRFYREEESRMQTLAASLRQGKETAAITAALNVYVHHMKKNG
ncbi:MAG: acetyl-CoA carboxylase biotin carboxylase subunit [Methanocalculus sp. MSAO_Arc1]|uniref:acetyl-CoA carboxylase biotin carboxylase subunit n=1 Tax=Methanocalculus TaxID=71151 RepID=UPI000FF4CFC3|nr:MULTISPECIES: acetyl-CoA carboxylase biotin carboxylase subunit [unclassified Methanocalculus]MCP1661718.1 pyruvate carboxylase subunit A [Methanocalculus sp. AMF5]RQD80245.1 MAG: acetyl-CoA carboxylase biotin carboxylase subunit [Methanocalculus sp. MSAO_Arc1]